MIPQNNRPVNTPIKIDSLFDADLRTIKNARGDRLALTKAQMIVAAENRYGCEYEHARRHQGGVGYVDVLVPVEGPADGSRPSTPWVHLLPWTDTTYLIRARSPNYGAPDWRESELMHEHMRDAEAAEWLAGYQQFIAENGINDPDNLEDMS